MLNPLEKSLYSYDIPSKSFQKYMITSSPETKNLTIKQIYKSTPASMPTALILNPYDFVAGVWEKLEHDEYYQSITVGTDLYILAFMNYKTSLYKVQFEQE
jgi:hypothetical protein